MNEWISVKDRLPKPEDDPWGGNIFLVLNSDMGPYTLNGRYIRCDGTFTHWMAIPPAPETRPDCMWHMASLHPLVLDGCGKSAGRPCYPGAEWCEYEGQEERADCTVEQDIMRRLADAEKEIDKADFERLELFRAIAELKYKLAKLEGGVATLAE